MALSVVFGGYAFADILCVNRPCFPLKFRIYCHLESCHYHLVPPLKETTNRVLAGTSRVVSARFESTTT